MGGGSKQRPCKRASTAPSRCRQCSGQRGAYGAVHAAASAPLRFPSSHRLCCLISCSAAGEEGSLRSSLLLPPRPAPPNSGLPFEMPVRGLRSRRSASPDGWERAAGRGLRGGVGWGDPGLAKRGCAAGVWPWAAAVGEKSGCGCGEPGREQGIGVFEKLLQGQRPPLPLPLPLSPPPAGVHPQSGGGTPRLRRGTEC